MSSKNISYVLVIRRTLIITTCLLFMMLFYQGVFLGTYSQTLVRETFDLDMLTQKGPLVSKPFQVDKSTTFYELNFEKRTSSFTGDSLLLNVKVLSEQNKVINEFLVNFVETGSYSYRDRWKQVLFKAKQKQKLRVTIRVLRNNIDKTRSAKDNYYLRFRVTDKDGKVAMDYYYRVFIYSFFAMLVMIFIPKKWF